MTIELKSWPNSFDAVAAGLKTAEIRSLEDRQFQIGDTVILRRWDPTSGMYTGATARILIRHIDVTAGAYALLGVRLTRPPIPGCLTKIAVLSFTLLEVTP